MKKTFLLILGLMLSSLAFSETKYVCSNYNLRVRAEPSLNAEKIGSIPKLAAVEVLETTDVRQEIDKVEDYWVKVSYQNLTGYVFGAFLMDDYNAAKEMLEYEGVWYVDYIKDYANLTNEQLSKVKRQVYTLEYLGNGFYKVTSVKDPYPDYNDERRILHGQIIDINYSKKYDTWLLDQSAYRGDGGLTYQLTWENNRLNEEFTYAFGEDPDFLNKDNFFYKTVYKKVRLP